MKKGTIHLSFAALSLIITASACVTDMQNNICSVSGSPKSFYSQDICNDFGKTLIEELAKTQPTLTVTSIHIHVEKRSALTIMVAGMKNGEVIAFPDFGYDVMDRPLNALDLENASKAFIASINN